MNATPVVLVGVYNGKQVLLPFRQDLRAHKALVTQAKTQATHQLPVSTSSPREPNRRASLGKPM